MYEYYWSVGEMHYSIVYSIPPLINTLILVDKLSS